FHCAKCLCLAGQFICGNTHDRRQFDGFELVRHVDGPELEEHQSGHIEINHLRSDHSMVCGDVRVLDDHSAAIVTEFDDRAPYGANDDGLVTAAQFGTRDCALPCQGSRFLNLVASEIVFGFSPTSSAD